MSDPAYSNRLAHATSPYLLQHAHNPVDWYEWGTEALTRAKAEDKPILVSIGYSSCHWCHVMERESFENEAIAKIMNGNFVCIKVDREERPDIDQVYMEAVHAMQQKGGWPLNVFLTPDQKPFYGGTYFPPQPWTNLLLQLTKAFDQRRKDIDNSAEDLRKHLQTSDIQRFAQDPTLEKFSEESLHHMFSILEKRFDKTWGGMDKAPKFVMPSIWLWLLRYHHSSKNQVALEMVTQTLLKMSMGGLYDQLGGGFSRYSVDPEWFAPHFEKMLYDNGQLLSLYAEAHAATHRTDYRVIVEETVNWLVREMMHPEGGFYAALDADSEGEEGRFYTWTWDELTEVLSANDVTPAYYNATPTGNWEKGRNILIRSDNDDSFMSDFNINKHDLDILVAQGKKKLLAVREKRVHPGLDDKVLTGWNCMTIHGLTDAYKSFGDRRYLDLAVQCTRFLEKYLIQDGKVYRAFKGRHSDAEGFLEDYAFLIQAYTSLYQVTFNEEWIRKAERWCEYVMKHFYDGSEGFFHYSSSAAEQLIARKKEIFDNVIPSSNAVMARNLYHLGILLDRADWKSHAEDMTSRLTSLIESEPGYMCHWAILFTEITHTLAEVVIVGKQAESMRRELQANYQPFSLTLGAEKNGALPLFEGRESRDDKTRVFVCVDKTCQLPVERVADALNQLNS